MHRIRRLFPWLTPALIAAVLVGYYLISTWDVPAIAQSLRWTPDASDGDWSVRSDMQIYFDSTPQQSVATRQQRIDALKQALAAAQSDADRQAARDALRQLLSEIFAEDMRVRNLEASAIESRVRALREQYRAREQRKDEILELWLRVIENSAAGLDFPTTAQPAVGGNDPNSDAMLNQPNTTTDHSVQPGATMSSDAATNLPPTQPPAGDAADPGVAGTPGPAATFLDNAVGSFGGPAAWPSAGRASRDGSILEYHDLRTRYLAAKANANELSAQFDQMVAAILAAQPNQPLDNIKKRYERHWRLVQQAQRDFEEVEHLLDTKLHLLQIDLAEAKAALSAAEAQMSRIQAAAEAAAVSQSEVDEQKALTVGLQFQVERAQTIHDLFASIKYVDRPVDPEAQSKSQPLSRHWTPTTAAETLEWMSGTWHFLPATVNLQGSIEGVEHVWIEVSGEKAILNYVTTNGQRYQREGMVSVNADAQPPEFEIEFAADNPQESMKLKGRAELNNYLVTKPKRLGGPGRAVQPVSMVREGGRLLDEIESATEPDQFDFMHPLDASENG